MYNTLINLIKDRCEQAIVSIYPQVNLDLIEVTSTAEGNAVKFGDYQCNSCMKISKIVNQSPRQTATEMVNYLQLINEKDLIFSSIEIAGPGFINFTLSDQFLVDNIESLLATNKFLWDKQQDVSQFKKVIVDFSSPNIAKEMHVGHLRSTIVGDCIARMLEYVGHQVLRINHVGDWGTQFGMLIAYLKLHDKLNDNISLDNLVDYYKKAKAQFDTDLHFKQFSQKEVIKLQQGSKESLQIWEKICFTSIKAYREIYRLLDINIIDRGESFYNSMLEGVIQDFVNKNLLVESNGAKCIYLENFIGRDNNLLPLIIQKSDGGYNYATTDLAAIKHRVKKENADWIIYVTDNGQTLHFSMIFAAAEKVGYLQNKNVKLDHVPLGLVLRSDGKKFKTREGDTEKLIDLINNAIFKSEQLLVEKKIQLDKVKLKQLAMIIGVNAIKYADLSNNRNSDYVFDYDKMLKFTGNTAAFLSYAYVRINSIKRKYGVGLDVNKLMLNTRIQITNSYERNLAVRICKFPDILSMAIKELLPNRLTDYLYLLAEEFHTFFHSCRIVGSDLQDPRLLLCEAVAKIMQDCFKILGLQTTEQM
jgi:arginyl-tRNA synthetase